MNDPFRVVALDAELFAPWFAMSDEELRRRGARRTRADSKPGFPCRVSLVDAEVGETVLLLPFTHYDVATPYRAAGPIYVREGAVTARPAPGEVPEMLRRRLLSLRAFDSDAMLVASDVVHGAEFEDAVARLFADSSVREIHVHNAKPGCFDCRVVRV